MNFYAGNGPLLPTDGSRLAFTTTAPLATPIDLDTSVTVHAYRMFDTVFNALCA